MSIKIDGKPRFTHLQMMKLSIDRGPEGDGSEAVIAYVSEKTHEMFGSVTLAHNINVQHFGKKTRELMSQLVASIESDAARLVFGESFTEETKEEGLYEPKGLADGAEEAPQV